MIVNSIKEEEDNEKEAVIKDPSINTLNESKEDKVESIDKDTGVEDRHHSPPVEFNSCPCKQMLVSVHSTQCGICDQEITPIKKVNDKLARLKDSAHNIKSQIEESNSMYDIYVCQYKTLASQLEKRQLQLSTTTQQILSLKQDIEIVKTKHKEEIAHSIAIEESKLDVEAELHDLSKKLFEEANQMVSQEKEKKLLIQQEHDQVKANLLSAQTELEKVETELKALRGKMASVQQESQEPKSTHENFMLRAQLDMASVRHQPVEIQYTSFKDGLLLAEFTQAMHALKSVAFTKISTLAFMKHVIKMEIEPCLRLGPKMNYKRLIEPIVQQTCLFQPCPDGFLKDELTLLLQQQQSVTQVKKSTSLWGRLTSSNSSSVEDLSTTTTDSLRCFACLKILDIDTDSYKEQLDVWKFKTSCFEEWNVIDSFCKDRIQSVIDFYDFLKRLKIMNDNELTLSTKSLYEEYSRLQLQMLLSRMGILPTLLN